MIWRHIFKAQCEENIFAIQTLKDFVYVEENKDQGFNVREKAKALTAFVSDGGGLKNGRAKALRIKERFAGRDGEGITGGGVGGSGSYGATRYEEMTFSATSQRGGGAAFSQPDPAAHCRNASLGGGGEE